MNTPFTHRRFILRASVLVATLSIVGAAACTAPVDASIEDPALDENAITNKELDACKPFPGAKTPEPTEPALKQRCAQIAKGNTPPFDDTSPVCLGHNNDAQKDILNNCIEKGVKCQVLNAGKNYGQDWNRDLLLCIKAGYIGGGKVILCTDQKNVKTESATGSEWCWLSGQLYPKPKGETEAQKEEREKTRKPIDQDKDHKPIDLHTPHK